MVYIYALRNKLRYFDLYKFDGLILISCKNLIASKI